MGPNNIATKTKNENSEIMGIFVGIAVVLIVFFIKHNGEETKND